MHSHIWKIHITNNLTIHYMELNPMHPNTEQQAITDLSDQYNTISKLIGDLKTNLTLPRTSNAEKTLNAISNALKKKESSSGKIIQAIKNKMSAFKKTMKNMKKRLSKTFKRKKYPTPSPSPNTSGGYLSSRSRNRTRRNMYQSSKPKKNLIKTKKSYINPFRFKRTSNSRKSRK